MTKQELRQHIRALKHQHLTGDQSFCEASLFDRLSDCRVVMLYSALPDEVPTQSLLDGLVAQGKTVLLPRVVSATDMELRHYTGPHDLQVGAYGIFEPTGNLFTDYEVIDVAVIPGMAFDTAGHRLGRGKGYYDRFLSRIPHVYKIGLCFSWQIVGEVPCDAHDIVMDQVLGV